MRRRIVAGSLPLLFLLAGSGCISSNNGSPSEDGGAGFVPDATFFDAFVPAEASTTAPDTSAPSGVDAGAPDAPVDVAPQPVTVVITDGVAPLTGVTIVFQDPTGAVIASASTDAIGRVSQLLPSGSQVTALLGDALNAQIVTVVGVEPGDLLSAVASAPSSTIETVTVSSVPASPPAGTTNYVVSAGQCQTGSAAGPWSLAIGPSCQRGGSFPLLATAYDVNGAPLGFAYQKGNVFPDAGPRDASDDSGPDAATGLAIGGAWSTAFGTQTVTAANVPGSVAGVAAVSESTGGVITQSAQFFFSPAGDAGSADYFFSLHPGFADFLQSEANVNAGNFTDGGNGASVRALAVRASSASADGGVPFDLGQGLPLITNATVDTTTPGRPTTAWSSSASLAAADGAVVELRWSGFDQDAGTSFAGRWTVLAPPTATSVRLPALPAAQAAWAPPGDATFGVPVVLAVQGSFWSGYAQLRAQSAALTSADLFTQGYVGLPVVPPLPADGTLEMSAFTVNGD